MGGPYCEEKLEDGIELKEALELVETFTLVPPGAQAVFLLEKHKYQRSIAMSKLSNMTLVGTKHCAWCEKIEMVGRKKYCSKDCAYSAEVYFYPQSNTSKIWMLIHRQDCACIGCGVSFEEFLVKRIQRKFDYFNSESYYSYLGTKKPEKPVKLTYFSLGRDTGDIIHTDHKTPLFRGGKGVGIDNIQILCVKCHRRKTALERGI